MKKEGKEEYEAEINGKLISITDYEPPTQEKPYWTITLNEEESILATGNISIKLIKERREYKELAERQTKAEMDFDVFKNRPGK